MTPSAVVDTAWVQSQLAAADLLLLDASFYLPAESRDARAEYAAAHLPGARFFDIDAFSDTSSTLPHMIPTAAQAERLIGELGIANQHRVVFYDQKGLHTAARGWWTLRLFGHDRVHVLDGGLPKWRREGRAIETGSAARWTPQSYRVNYRSTLLRGLGDLLDNLQSHRELVLDARSPERFVARAPEPRPGIRGGHIPGSANVPVGDLLNSDGTLRSPEQLRARLSAAGVTADRPVVTSCGSGVMAALLALGIEVAGFGPAAVYDGSWTEWGGRTDTPVATED
jgi:thiosulfate/3-mercaptopyruvate sulfurtransferase